MSKHIYLFIKFFQLLSVYHFHQAIDFMIRRRSPFASRLCFVLCLLNDHVTLACFCEQLPSNAIEILLGIIMLIMMGTLICLMRILSRLCQAELRSYRSISIILILIAHILLCHIQYSY